MQLPSWVKLFVPLGVLGFITLLSLNSVSAEIHKCDVNGQTVFQDKPCKDALRVTDSAKKKNATPLHQSWLDKPKYLRSRVSCTEVKCTCGKQEYIYQNKDIRLLNAISGLKMRWRFHEGNITHYQSLGSNRNNFPAVMRNIEKSACSLAMDQKTVEKHYLNDAKEIFQDNQIAVDAREANKNACIKPDETGWTTSDEAKEWARCKDRNRTEHNKRVRLSKQKSVRHKALMSDLEYLKLPRQLEMKKNK